MDEESFHFLSERWEALCDFMKASDDMYAPPAVDPAAGRMVLAWKLAEHFTAAIECLPELLPELTYQGTFPRVASQSTSPHPQKHSYSKYSYLDQPRMIHGECSITSPPDVQNINMPRIQVVGQSAAIPAVAPVPCLCTGLREHLEATRWLSSLSDPARTVRTKGAELRSGVIHSVECCGIMTASCMGCCDACQKLWLSQSKSVNTQGRTRGSVYNAVKHWQKQLNEGGMTREQFLTLCQQTRKKLLSATATTPSVQEKLSQYAQRLHDGIKDLDKRGRLSQKLVEQLVEHMNNSWRTGKFVHGRRYCKDSVNVAMSHLLAMKGSDYIRRALSLNRVAILPSKRCQKRGLAKRVQPDFGIQPVSTFQLGKSILPQRRVHCCNDEVAVNGKLGRIACADGHQITGLANRCSRENCPVGFKYIVRQNGDVVVQRSTDLEGEHEILHLDALPSISEQEIATQLCVWLLFCPQRQSPPVFAGCVPTVGDLTFIDDCVFFHQIISNAFEAGLLVSFYGADNATPHALLSKGIVRSPPLTELKDMKREYDVRLRDIVGTVDDSMLSEIAADLMPVFQRPISALHHILRNMPSLPRPSDVSTMQWLVPYRGIGLSCLRCAVTGSYMSISKDWRHDNRLMASHLRDKPQKLVFTCFLPNAAPALLTDMLLLEDSEGRASGLCGSVLDMSDSTQNNKRAAEMSSFELAHALLDKMPGALGTSVHVIIAAVHRTSFADDCSVPPASPMARIAKAAFVFTFMTYHTIAVINGNDSTKYNPPASSFQHTVAVHGYTAPTRWAVMLALPSLLGLFLLQREDSAQKNISPSVVPQQMGSMACESLFSTWRSTTGQNTGSVSCSEALEKADRALIVNELDASGTLKLPMSRKAAKHRLHPDSAYTETLDDVDCNRSIHIGVMMCQDMLKAIGYRGILLRHKTLQSALQEMLELTKSQTPVRQSFFSVEAAFGW